MHTAPRWKWLAPFGVLVSLALLAPASAQEEEPIDRPGLRLAPPAAPDPPVLPTPIDPDPLRAQREAFHRTLDGIGPAAQRRARIEEARRIASFDLDWGLP